MAGVVENAQLRLAVGRREAPAGEGVTESGREADLYGGFDV